ncbi:MAG TPA: SIS domain-containing protein [Candidatus Paceibacterota bacterium]
MKQVNEIKSNNAEHYLNKLSKAIDSLNIDSINQAIDVIEKVWRSGKQIIAIGNGGSSVTALHMITDWNKSIFLSSKIPFRGRTLVDNVGLIMAYGNDISFEDIFIEQLKNILQSGDLVIAISGSGNSENVIRAVKYANNNGAVTLGLSGFDGGKLKEIAHHALWVNTNDMQLVEDIHSAFGHIVMQALCEK